MNKLFLLAPEVRDAILRLDRIQLPQRTLADWLASGIVKASLRWTDKPARKGHAARGSGNACRFTVDDFARVRLVAMLRYVLRLSLDEIRAILKEHGTELTAILNDRRTDAVLILDPLSRKVFIRRPGESDFDVRSNQFRLDLQPLTIGNDEAARMARTAA